MKVVIFHLVVFDVFPMFNNNLYLYVYVYLGNSPCGASKMASNLVAPIYTVNLQSITPLIAIELVATLHMHFQV